MKNFLLLTFTAILFLSSYVKAQSNFNYGLKISLTSSSIDATDKKPAGFYYQDTYYKGSSVNPSVGFFLNYKMNDNLYLETELSYIQKGSRSTFEVNYTTIEDPDGDGRKSDYTHSIDVRYLEFGLNIKPTIQLGNISAYAIIGSSANYTLNAMALMQDSLNDLMFSYKIGVGSNLKEILKMPLFVEIKYIGDYSKFYSYDYAKLWNRVIVFSIGMNMN